MKVYPGYYIAIYHADSNERFYAYYPDCHDLGNATWVYFYVPSSIEDNAQLNVSHVLGDEYLYLTNSWLAKVTGVYRGG